jgi:A/G-specific adenine glycosylase
MLSDPFEVLDFHEKLTYWYVHNHRALLWRQTTDPYKIWLSEIILQQTRVAQGTPYYERFVAEYPTVFDLAAADERDVLRLWQGLGYYSRARNMHYTAKQIVNDFEGEFPRTATELSKLKGLGNYTAAAIASFSFGEVAPAIDGNVYRVLSRLFGVFTDILSNDGKKEFALLSSRLISREDPATYNQAMIEFGALQCVPVSPNCSVCPFAQLCYAYKFNMQSGLPVKAKKASVRKRYFNYFIFKQGDRIGMQERSARDIWKGLYDFPMIESESDIESPDDLTGNEFVSSILQVGVISQIPKLYTHLLTHQRLNVRFWWVNIPESKLISLPSHVSFYTPDEVHDLPKPILIDTVLKEERYI